MDNPPGHTPVLMRAVSDLLVVQPGESVVDATVGAGGHARMLAERVGSAGTLIGLDVDPSNIELSREALAEAECRVELRRANFSEIESVLEAVGIARVDVILADLGMSSTQLDDAERGFSFQREGPLDMRLDSRLTVTATELVNRLKERELGDLIYFNAQETASRRIARRICEARREKRITTTAHLAQIVAGAVRGSPASRKSKIHPATRTFLALRIAVNDEIGCLEALLAAAPRCLTPGGRIGVIAFHSVEDKPVKLDFRRRKGEKVYEIITKKPVIADPEERWANPRSRSAKLRVARRLPE